MFSERFYDQMFQNALILLQTSTASEAVNVIKIFSDKQSYVQEFTRKSEQFKEHIAQDMEKTSISDLCHMIEIFKDDHSFNRYLVICFIDKLKGTAKLEFDAFIVGFINSLQHREFLPNLMEALISFEQFHVDDDSNYELYYKILDAANRHKLYEHEEGRKLIKTIQLKLAILLDHMRIYCRFGEHFYRQGLFFLH